MEQVTAQDIAAWDADLQTLKNSWGLAEHAGLPTPRPFEHLLDGAVWDADLLRDQVRDYVVAGLGSTDAILIADDTQAIKKGSKSVGVAP